VKNTFPVFVPVHKRLIAEFIAQREEILKASSQAQPSRDTEEKLREIDVMLEGLAAQELPN